MGGDRERVVVCGGTAAVQETLDPLAGPGVERERQETQAKRFKRRSAPGALQGHEGIKKRRGPDRPPMRAREAVIQALVAADEQGEPQECEGKARHEQGAESQEPGPTTRLHQRARR